ncbi:hypothetical protein MMC24_001427 [Lignoscripta atroalba]|nr:hypothetical protein [Lignoscripta atroalba]
MSRAAGGKKFTKLDVKRVYFGNWLRDYSQAVDVGTVKYVSAEAIRLILWVLGFMSFGYGTKEFEVTTDRLGCYRPEEHIDNPKDYADNLDARQYDRRLRGPVDERRELSIDRQTGLKTYIASEDAGIATSAGLVRNLFGRSIQLGRQFAQTGNEADLHEALRLLGTGCHCLEDYSAHSNYTELSLIELRERGVFPHVGRQTQINLPGIDHPVYPLITGTFGGVDFLHSVMGELSDKATQSEIQELQGTIQQSQNNQADSSVLQDLLNQVPSGLFGDKDEAGKVDELRTNAQAAQLQNTHITPREPEEWTQQVQEVSKQIYPIIEWHDEVMQSITETIEKIPILPDLLEQLQEQINVFVFSLLAPFVLPIIDQVKTELATGSSEIIKSSRDKQLIVFRDDRCSDPTHSMLSKDHFSNILNEPSGKVASQVLKWVVPQLIACWDDEEIDINRTLTRIVTGVFHHPALRDYGDDGADEGRRLMFGVVEQWWGDKDEQEREVMRDQLSRDGVEQGRNHKEGVHDNGHGCGKPLGMPTAKTSGSSGAIGGPVGNILEGITSALAGESEYDAGVSSGGARPNANKSSAGFGNFDTGEQQQRYGQGQTRSSDQGQYQEHQRYGQGNRSGYGDETGGNDRPMYGGGYEDTTQTRSERRGGAWESEPSREERSGRGEAYGESRQHHGSGGYERNTVPGAFEEERDESRQGYGGHRTQGRESEGQSGYGEERPSYGSGRVPGGFETEQYEERRRPEFQQEFEPERSTTNRRNFDSRDEVDEGFTRQEQLGGGRFRGGDESVREEGEDRSYGRGEDRSYGRGEDRSDEQDGDRGYRGGEDRGYGQDENRGYAQDEDRGYGRGGDRSYGEDEGRGYEQDEGRGYGGGEDEERRREYRDDY